MLAAVSSVATVAVLCCAFVSAESATLDDCAAMDIVELSMIEPRLADCHASAVFVEAASSWTASDDLCGETATCGGLLPYLAYMKKRPCLQRAAFDDLSGTLLELCDANLYRNADPKSVLVGKPPARSEL
jgi:hypothetical protein